MRVKIRKKGTVEIPACPKSSEAVEKGNGGISNVPEIE
jgi:hypothetical protein